MMIHRFILNSKEFYGSHYYNNNNETHKILWDFEIQIDHPIPFRRPDLILIHKKKRTCHQVDFAV